MLLEEDVLYDQCVLLAKLCNPLPCFILYSKVKLACYFRYRSTSTFAFQSPMMIGHLFCMLVLEGLVGHHRTIQLQLLWGIDLDYCDIELFALEMNRDHSVVFEIAPKYCILDSC